MSTDQTAPIAPEPPRPATPTPITPAPATPGSLAVPTQPVTAQPVVAAPKAKSSGRLLNAVLAVAVAVAIGGVFFAIGRSTAPVAAAGNGRGTIGNGAFPRGSFAPGASGAPGFGRGGGFGGGFGGGVTVSGTVESVTADTLTIKTASGQTIEVSLGSDTTYHSQASASPSDVQTGKTVQVQLQFAGGGRATASGAPSGPVGTAGSVTVVP